jgi:PPM family protein phosphatase
VLDDETIGKVLTAVEEPAAAVEQLIELANEGGGPDNITCVVADVVDRPAPEQEEEAAVVVGAAAVAAD